MATIQKSVKSGLLTMPGFQPVQTNSPDISKTLKNPYDRNTAEYYYSRAKYGDNVFNARMQGLNYKDFYAWQNVKIRSASVIDPSTGEVLSTSFQKIYLIGRKFDFIPIGAYVKFAGATWIVFNPENIASTIATAVVLRCNSTYNSLDYYGNVVKTPVYMSRGSVLASSPYYMEYSAIIDGYQHIIMQYNEQTANVHDNTRMIMGRSAFAMYGVVNFSQEFDQDIAENPNNVVDTTLDVDTTYGELQWKKPSLYYGTTIGVDGKTGILITDTPAEAQRASLKMTSDRDVTATVQAEEEPFDGWNGVENSHLLRADIRVDEVIESDDLKNRVANGKELSFTISVGGLNDMRVGDTTQLAVSAKRNGVAIESTAKYPLTYLWGSSDEDIATVDGEGNVTAIAPGDCQITCVLQQNTNITSTFEISVSEASTGNFVDFDTPIHGTLQAMRSTTVQAYYYENGEKTSNPVEYTFSGAEDNSYSVEILPEGGVKITCWYAASEPLEITAKFGEYSATEQIKLTGY